LDSVNSGLKNRAEKMRDSPYDFINWLLFGTLEMVKGSVSPKDPLSKEHWLNSIGTATLLGGIIKPKASTSINTKTPITQRSSKAKYSDNLENHFVQGEGIGPKQKGVLGAHNADYFNRTLESKGFPLEQLKLGDPIPHPTIDGVYAQYYTVPGYVRGEFSGFKKIRDPKTLYDPTKISDSQMIQWGKEAMKNGTIQPNGRVIGGFASNGLEFRGFIENGIITNFFPIVPTE
jgi:hypothetical protein